MDSVKIAVRKTFWTKIQNYNHLQEKTKSRSKNYEASIFNLLTYNEQDSKLSTFLCFIFYICSKQWRRQINKWSVLTDYIARSQNIHKHRIVVLTVIINCKRSHRQSSQIDKITGKINGFLVDETQARSRSVDIYYANTSYFSFFAKENGKKRLEDTSFWRLSLNSTTMKLLLSSMGDFWLQMTNDRTTMDWVLLLKPFLWADRLIIRPLQTVSQWKGPFWDSTILVADRKTC